jgi:hypothetical protein
MNRWRALILLRATPKFISENKMKNCLENKGLGSKGFPLISCSAIFLLSIFLRSRLDIGGDSAVYLDLAAKIASGGRYYYDFFESNFPLSFWIHTIPYFAAKFLGLSPIITSDIFVNSLGIISIFFSARILEQSVLSPIHQNLITISFALGFFLRIHGLEVNEFATKTSFFLLLAFPYISFSFARKTVLSTQNLIWRGVLAGLIPCLKPHYIFLPLLIELHRFWQKKSLRFFLELDKLVMCLTGLLYLFLMIKFTPEFFEFMVPMWSVVYISYSDLSHFLENSLYQVESKITQFGGFFLVFLRQKLCAEDRILLLVFAAACLIIITENLGSIDQEALFSGLTIFIFVKIFYDFTQSKTFSWKQNKITLGIALMFLIFAPKILFSFVGSGILWWIMIPLVIASLHQNLKENSHHFARKNAPLIITLIASTLTLLLFLLSSKLIAKNPISFTGISTAIFLSFLFFYEVIRKKFSQVFSPSFVFAQLALILNLSIYFFISLAHSYSGENGFKSPNFLSDSIISYSRANLHSESDRITIWSYFISESFPALTHLNQLNSNAHSTAGFLYSGIGNDFFSHSNSGKKDKSFTLNYFFDDLKKQVRDKNIKIIFLYRGELCKIGFLENYFRDPEFRKIFLENYHFAGRIFSSRLTGKKSAFSQDKPFDGLDLPSLEIVNDFEIYARNDR